MTTVSFGDPSTHINLEVATTLFALIISEDLFEWLLKYSMTYVILDFDIKVNFW